MTLGTYFSGRSSRCAAAKSFVVIAFFYAFICPAVTFPLPTINATSGTSQAIVTGDFYGNGHVAIVTADGDASPNTTTLTLWENDGLGDFSPEATIDTLSQPGSLAATTVFLSTADFNHDGKVDLLVFSVNAGQAQWAVYLGNGNGTFQAAKYGPMLSNISLPLPPVTPAYILGSAQPYGIGDLKGDNIPDIVCGDQVFIGNGDGTFKSAATFTGGGANILLADFDGDGKLDVVGVSQGELSFAKGNGDGTFQAAKVTTIQGGYWAAVGDFNADGKPDVLTSGGLGLSVLPGVGDGTFGTVTTTSISSIVGGTTCGNVCVVDLNGDGKDDVIVVGAVVTVVVNTVTESTTPLYFLSSNGQGGFTSGGGLTPTGIALSTTYSSAIVPADFNGDLRPDLLLSGSAYSEPLFATSLGAAANLASEGVLQVSIQPPGSGTVTAGYLGSSLRTLGATNNIAAAAASGVAFTNWTGGAGSSQNILTNGLTVHFLMQKFLRLQANFQESSTPTLTVTSPANDQKLTNALANLTGTTTDKLKVGGVWNQLNGGAWSLASTSNSFTNWTATLTLVAGTNTIKSFAQNLGGIFSLTNNLSVISSNTFKLQLVFTNSLPKKANGLDFSLQLSTGLDGHIQVSTNLTSWVVLTNFIGTNAMLNFRDPAATNSSRRFYRAVIP